MDDVKRVINFKVNLVRKNPMWTGVGILMKILRLTMNLLNIQDGFKPMETQF